MAILSWRGGGGRGSDLYGGGTSLTYLHFHKTLPSASAFINWNSVRFYETDYKVKSNWHRTVKYLDYRGFH